RRRAWATSFSQRTNEYAWGRQGLGKKFLMLESGGQSQGLIRVPLFASNMQRSRMHASDTARNCVVTFAFQNRKRVPAKWASFALLVQMSMMVALLVLGRAAEAR